MRHSALVYFFSLVHEEGMNSTTTTIKIKIANAHFLDTEHFENQNLYTGCSLLHVLLSGLVQFLVSVSFISHQKKNKIRNWRWMTHNAETCKTTAYCHVHAVAPVMPRIRKVWTLTHPTHYTTHDTPQHAKTLPLPHSWSPGIELDAPIHSSEATVCHVCV